MMRRVREFIGTMLRSRRAWVAPMCFSCVYFFVQLTQLSSYGVTWDEPLHRNWGKIFALFWRTGDRHLLELMPGHGIDYGPLYFYLNYVVSEFFFTRGWLTFVESNHVLTLLVSAVAVGLTYQLGRMIGGIRTAVFSTMFLVLFPQFIAHAHYNPKDIPLMTSVLLTSVVFLAALRNGSVKLFLFSGFLFGISSAVKINALLMGPVFAVVYLAWFIMQARTVPLTALFRRQLFVILGAASSFIFALYLFWPSAWGDLLLIPRAVHFFLGKNFWPGRVLFLGIEYGGADLPFTYIPFEYAAAMPLLMLVACIMGVGIALRRAAKSGWCIAYIFLLIWVLFPLAFSMKPGLVRYDGMRQFFFLLPAFAVLSALGLEQMMDLLRRKSRRPHAGAVFLGLVFVSLASQVLMLHPFEGSFRSEILQLLYERNLDESFQIEYWGASYKQGMDWLTENAEPHPVICVPTAGILVTWYPWREDFQFECSEKTNYVMFFTRYTESKAYAHLRDPAFSIERMKSTLLVVYKI